jgi:hypothetical protein
MWPARRFEVIVPLIPYCHSQTLWHSQNIKEILGSWDRTLLVYLSVTNKM